MHINLIRIGNSQGIRLPKAVIEQAGLAGELDLEATDGVIIIRSARRPRQGWAEASADCHSAGEDRLDDWDSTTADFQGKW